MQLITDPDLDVFVAGVLAESIIEHNAEGENGSGVTENRGRVDLISADRVRALMDYCPRRAAAVWQH